MKGEIKMFKKRIWLGIILSVIFLVFSINGFTAYYKYTQESGTNFYVGTDDKADALEDTNEVRQILDDLGNLLGHSKRDDLYPKDSTTGGYLGKLNYGLEASKPAVPVVNDMYLATDTVKVYRCFVAGNWVQVYPEGGITTFIGLTDTPASYTGSAGKYPKVNTGETALEFTTLDLSLYYLKTEMDSSGELAGIISDETGTGALVFATAPVIDFTTALASDHTYSGDIDSEPVGETVAFGKLLYFNWTDKEWKLAKADVATTMPGLRIALEIKADSETCKMLVKGYIRDDSAFEFAGAMVYVSATTAGAMTSTAPSTTGQQVQRTGVAKSADILFFDPSIDVGEI
jgi:hypothetical protein